MLQMSYAWSFPSHQTFKMKPVRDFIELHMEGDVILDPFANRRVFDGVITNDINPNSEVDYHMDALDFLKMFDDGSVDFLFFDPPYSLRQLKECYDGIGRALTHRESKRFFSDLKDEIQRVMKPKGKVMSFGWSSVGMSAARGFTKEALLLVCHGGIHQDTIVLLETFYTG